MRVRLGIAAAALMGVTSFAAPSRAQFVAGRASVSLAGSYTDTVTDAPYPTALSVRGPSVSVTPALFLMVETPRTSTSIDYAFALTVPFGTSFTVTPTSIGYTNRLNLGGRFDLDPLTTLTLLGGVSAGPVTTLNTAQTPIDTQAQAIPPGLLYMITVNLQQALVRELGKDFSITESVAATYTDPINPLQIQATTTTLRPGLALSREFGANTLSFSLVAAYTRFGVSEGPNREVVDAHNGLANTAAVTWMRALTPTLLGTATLGVTQNIDFDGPRPPPAQLGVVQAVQPTGGATLTYALRYAETALSYAHQQMVNAAASTSTFSDVLSLRVSAPLGATGFATMANAVFTHMVPTDGVTLPSNVYVADLGLNYTPPRAPTVTAGLRGQVTRQTATMDPTSSFTRYAVSLSLTFSYPDPSAMNAPRPSFAPLFSAVPMTVGDPAFAEPRAPAPEPPPEK